MDPFITTLAASFWGSVLALTMFWGAFQTMRYKTDDDVPVWVWVAVWLPFGFGALFTVAALAYAY